MFWRVSAASALSLFHVASSTFELILILFKNVAWLVKPEFASRSDSRLFGPRMVGKLLRDFYGTRLRMVIQSRQRTPHLFAINTIRYDPSRFLIMLG
jgi:hypothetical protein